MIKSMTGFGRGEYADESYRICIEMKSVNHRYLDLGIRMPKKCSSFDGQIRSELKKYAQRGKLDVFITYDSLTQNQVSIQYNSSVAKEYYEILTKMADEFSIENNVNTIKLARFPEVITLEDGAEDEQQLWMAIRKALSIAGEKFVESRKEEGENLKKDLLVKLEEMKEKADFIEQHFPEIIKDYRERLEEKVKELLENTQIDENRILTEVALIADKLCVDEEVVRLKSHMDTMKKALLEGGEIGRKLDFISQEMNRETNTILSKIGDIKITNCAIELKTDIEKIREQVQNIE